MNRNVLMVGLMVLVVAIGAGLFQAYTYFSAKKDEVRASDAKVEHTFRVIDDSYQGYFFLESPEMKRRMLQRGINATFTNDGGRYADRLAKFANREADIIVLPISSYVAHGEKHGYPGVIVGAIAESQGADAILCFANKLPTGKVQDLNDASLKIVYTGDSPSSFLIDAMIKDFDLDNLKRVTTWKVEVDSSEEAYKKAKNRDGDCFVMWEPDIQRALRDVPGLKKVWGSDQFRGYIVDVIVVHRRVAESKREHLIKYLEAYFHTLQAYKNDRARLITEMAAWAKLSSSEVEAVLKEIYWYDLNDNASRMFGINIGVGGTSIEGVMNTIMASTNVLVASGRLQKDPLNDPYKIINASFMEDLLKRLPQELGRTATQRQFAALSEEGWRGLREVGMMRVEPITFQPNSSSLLPRDEELVDEIAKLLKNNYPDMRVAIRGHTSRGSDEQESMRLSRERAEAVMQRLIAVHGIDPNRLRTEGYGWSVAPTKKDGESPRSLLNRTSRVELVLFADRSSF